MSEAGTDSGGQEQRRPEEWAHLPHESAPWRPRPGLEVAGYTLEARLGTGGQGTVFRATRGGQQYAVKFLFLPRSAPWAWRERDVMVKLSHAGGVPLVDEGVWPEHSPLYLFLVMPLVRGLPLDVWTRLHNPDARTVAQLMRLGGRQLSVVHAAGVIMSSEPLVDVIPLLKRPSDGAMITQFDYPTCESLGLVKMDFLGLRNLTILDDAIDYTNETCEYPIEVVQTVIFAIQIALGELLKHHGANPGAVVGQSLGEAAAAYFSGGLSLEDATRTICSRAHLMGEGEAMLFGEYIRLMALVEYSADEIKTVFSDYPGLEVCVYAAPTQTVIGGPPEQIDAIVAARGILGRDSHRLADIRTGATSSMPPSSTWA